MKLNFLVVGSGGREHAIAQKLSESVYLQKLYLADPNDGFAGLGEVVKYENYEDLAIKAKKLKIDIATIGPENPLCDGIVDIFQQYGIKCIGVNKKWSQLESSKYFAKKFMEKHGIKTASYQFLTDSKDFSPAHPPYVIKADGLCKGKGVTITADEAEAKKIIKEYLDGKFGYASKNLLVEEFLEGEELSLMSLWDGINLISFIPAKDFKTKSSDPYSPNTGGMGAYCPVDLNIIQSQKLKEYEKKLEKALQDEEADFTGFIYSGLIWHKNDFYVLEYNVRLGDPETQVLLSHLDTDFGELERSAHTRKVSELKLKWKQGYSACIVLSADTYPEKSSVGEEIKNLPQEGIFYAGVKKEDGKLYTNGGRILSVCTTGIDPFESARQVAQHIDFKGKYYRADIDIGRFVPEF